MSAQRDRERSVNAEQAITHPCVVEKIRRDTSGMRSPSPRSDHTTQDSSTKKISLHDFWL